MPSTGRRQTCLVYADGAFCSGIREAKRLLRSPSVQLRFSAPRADRQRGHVGEVSAMPVDQVNEVELYWEQRGTGPRLLFCNGSGLTLQDVRPLLDLLTASFALLAWDYRGFGHSAPVTHPYTMADVAADAAGLLEIAGWESCRVVGVSFGGMVAQEFAVTNPGRVERLALACTSARGEGGSSYRCKSCWSSRGSNGRRRS